MSYQKRDIRCRAFSSDRRRRTVEGGYLSGHVLSKMTELCKFFPDLYTPSRCPDNSNLFSVLVFQPLCSHSSRRSSLDSVSVDLDIYCATVLYAPSHRPNDSDLFGVLIFQSLCSHPSEHSALDFISFVLDCYCAAVYFPPAMVSQAGSESKYDLDDGPLSPEVIQALDAIEMAQKGKQAQTTPSQSPRQRRPQGSARKRQRSSPAPSELILSTRLRGASSLKATSRAELAGLTPKSNHALRRDDPSTTPTIAKRAPSTDSNPERSQAKGPNHAGSEGPVDHGAFAGPVNPYYHTYGQSGPQIYTMMQHGHPQPHGPFPVSGLTQPYLPGGHFPQAAGQPYLHPGSAYSQTHAAGMPQDYAPGAYANNSGLPPFLPPVVQYNPGPGASVLPAPSDTNSNDPLPAKDISSNALVPSLYASSDHSAIHGSKPKSGSEYPRRASNPSPSMHPPPVQMRPRPQSEAPIPTTDTSYSGIHSAGDPRENLGCVQPRPVKSLDYPTHGPDAINNIFSPQYVPPPESDKSYSTRDDKTIDSSAMDTPRPHAGTGGTVIPSLAVQAPTPALHSKLSTASNISDSPSWNEGLDEDEDVGYERLDSSPTVGRLSAAKSEALKKGLGKIDASFKHLSAETGLSVSQIYDRWQLIQFRLPTLWNIYQQYFAENSEAELARLPPEQRPRPGAISTVQHTSDCYKYFKTALGKPAYGKKLQTWYQLHSLSTTDDMTMAQRERQFRKLDDKIQNLGRYYSTHFGFEVITIMVGSVINQDQNLGKLVMTPGAVDFFHERFRATDDIVLSHMKAHVYDRISKQIIAEGDDQPAMQLPNKSAVGSSISRPSLSNGKPSARSSGSRAQSIQLSSRTAPSVKAEISADIDLSDPEKLESSQLIAVLRKKFEDIGEEHKLAIMKTTGGGQRLQWKPLLQITSAGGYVFVNWPEGVDFPGDPPSASKKSLTKGIASLSRKALLSLLAAFDHPVHPLRLEKRYDGEVPTDEPVVIGVPPDANSVHSRGRRKFLDEEQNEDREGPPRLTSNRSSRRRGKSTTRSSAPPAKRKRKRLPMEDFIVEEEDEEEDSRSVESYCPEEEEDNDDDIEEPSPKRLRSSTASKVILPEKEEKRSEEEEEEDLDVGMQPADHHEKPQDANAVQDSQTSSRPSATAADAVPSSKVARDNPVSTRSSTTSSSRPTPPSSALSPLASTKRGPQSSKDKDCSSVDTPSIPVAHRTAGSPSAGLSMSHPADIEDRAGQVAQQIFCSAESHADSRVGAVTSSHGVNRDSHALGMQPGSSVTDTVQSAKVVQPGSSAMDTARSVGMPPQYPYFAHSGPYNWPSHLHPWQQPPPDQQQPSGPGHPHPTAYNPGAHWQQPPDQQPSLGHPPPSAYHHGPPQYMFNAAPSQAPLNPMHGTPYQNYPYFHPPPPQGPHPPHWNNDQRPHAGVASSSGGPGSDLDNGEKVKK